MDLGGRGVLTWSQTAIVNRFVFHTLHRNTARLDIMASKTTNNMKGRQSPDFDRNNSHRKLIYRQVFSKKH